MPPATRAAAAAPAYTREQPDPPTHAPQEVEHTSLAHRAFDPDEVTLRFNRWHAHAATAYQKGQYAGFKRDVAQRLIASGVAVVVETAQQRRDAADRFMLTK